MKICLSCAAGGHLDELLEIIEAFEGHSIFFVTIKSEVIKNLEKSYRVRNIHEPPSPSRLWKLNIHKFQLLSYYISLIIPCLIILLKERPDIVIGSGGEATLNISYLAKLIGKKVIYLESLARVHDISGTGKLVYYIADLFLVQWEGLLVKYPKAKYWGRIL